MEDDEDDTPMTTGDAEGLRRAILANALREWRWGPWMADLTADSFIVDGVAREACIYTLTADTGVGKTAFACLLAIAVASGEGERLLGRKVEQGKVYFISLEQPKHVRWRLVMLARRYGINRRVADNVIIEKENVDHKTIHDRMKSRLGDGPFKLIVVDTMTRHHSAYIVKQCNLPSNDGGKASMSNYLSLFQPILELPGKPTVLLLAHPNKPSENPAIKQAMTPGGSYQAVTDVEGNLTLKPLRRDDPSSPVVLGYERKMRGKVNEIVLIPYDDRAFDGDGNVEETVLLRIATAEEEYAIAMEREAKAKARERRKADKAEAASATKAEPRGKLKAKAETSAESKIRKALEDNPGASSYRIIKASGVPETTAKRILRAIRQSDGGATIGPNTRAKDRSSGPIDGPVAGPSQ